MSSFLATQPILLSLPLLLLTHPTNIRSDYRKKEKKIIFNNGKYVLFMVLSLLLSIPDKINECKRTTSALIYEREIHCKFPYLLHDIAFLFNIILS